MTALLLDTNVLISRARSPGGYDFIAVSSLTYAELEFGISAAIASGEDASHETIRHREQLLVEAKSLFGAGLAFDDAAAAAYRHITAYVMASLPRPQRKRVVAAGGVSPRRNAFDLQIAAVALANDMHFGTANVADLVSVQKLISIVPM